MNKEDRIYRMSQDIDEKIEDLRTGLNVRASLFEMNLRKFSWEDLRLLSDILNDELAEYDKLIDKVKKESGERKMFYKIYEQISDIPEAVERLKPIKESIGD